MSAPPRKISNNAGIAIGFWIFVILFASLFAVRAAEFVPWVQPLLIVSVVSAAVFDTITSWWRWRRQVERERQGLCVNCGYDVRSCTDRCAECGEKI